MEAPWQHREANPTSAEMRLFPLFLRQTPVGDCTSSEEVPDAWSLSPSDPIFKFSCTISGFERGRKIKKKERKGGWEVDFDRWGRSVENRAGLGTGWWLQQERKTTLLDTFYKPLCSYQAPGCVEQRAYTNSILGLTSLTDRFNLFHCHGGLEDKSIHHTLIFPSINKLRFHTFKGHYGFPSGFMFRLGTVVNLNIVSGFGIEAAALLEVFKVSIFVLFINKWLIVWLNETLEWLYWYVYRYVCVRVQ